MKFKDLSIRAQIILGFSGILLLVVLLGITSIFYISSLWQNTSDLYNHPFVVSRTVVSIKADMIAMHRSMKDVGLSESNEEIDKYVMEYEKYKSQVDAKFDIVYESYLGPTTDIDTAFNAFNNWHIITAETIRLKREGKNQDVKTRIQSNGIGGNHVNLMLSKIDNLNSFAKNKADEYYQNSSKYYYQSETVLWIMIIVFSFISIVILILLLRNIRRPLFKLAATAEKVRSGNYSARAELVEKNEMGLLASTFNSMAETIETEIKINTLASELIAKLLSENELKEFSSVLLKELCSISDAHLAAFYLNQSGTLKQINSLGFDAKKSYSFDLDKAEGEFGRAFNLNGISTLKGHDTFEITTFAGSIPAKEIITIPIFEQNKPVAAVALASLNGFSELSKKLFANLHLRLSARINAVLAYHQIVEFSDQIIQVNTELEQQAGELNMQADELKKYNLELEIQKNQLNEASRLKSAFLSNMSHELRTPLNSVIALSGVLGRKLKGIINEEEYSYIDVITRNGRNLLTLINEILDLSRIESGKEDFNYSGFSASELILELFMVLKPNADEKQIQLINHIPSDFQTIHSDRDKTKHILQNLLANALKFTETGSIEVDISIKNQMVAIAVKDTGIGIDEEKVPIIFDEFRQADEKTSRKYGGTGLGLAIAKKYSEFLGGSIQVETSPGKGSTFTLLLPFDKKAPFISNESKKILPAISVPKPPNAADTPTILIVEDNQSQIIQLTYVLESAGYKIKVATNGADALKLISEALPDAIILDLMMPEMDGFEVLKTIRRDIETLIPVLILTAKHLTKEDLSTLKGNHITQIVQKGELNRAELLNKLNSIIEKQVEPAVDQQFNSTIKKAGDPTLLLIEDNPDNSMTIKALLGSKYFLITAEDGLSGIEKAHASKPKLILLDISLPDIDGFEVFNRLRAMESAKNTPIIAVTARAMKGDKELILNFGFNAYIPKPIDADLLEQTITQLLYGK